MIPLAIIISLVSAGIAEAQIAAVPITTAGDNWWQQLVNIVIENGIKPLLATLTLVIAGILTKALWQWASKLGIEVSQAQKDELQDAAVKALQWAIMKGLDAIEQNGWSHPVVQKQIKLQAAAYMKEKFPDAIDRAISNSGVDRDHLEAQVLDPVLTRLIPQVFAQAAASPATPTANGKEPIPVVDVGTTTSTR